jgi:DivIVA domain-containing protein
VVVVRTTEGKTAAMSDRSSSSSAAKDETGRKQPESSAADTTLSRHVPADIRDISFHTAVRGYERREVDRYVQRVNTVIAELEIAGSPEAAVRHALDRVGEQTSGILQQARETADAIIETARTEGEDAMERTAVQSREIVDAARTEAAAIVAGAGREAHDLLQQGERELAEAREQAEHVRAAADAALAEARSHADEIVGKAEREKQALLEERRSIVEDVHALAARLEAAAGDSAAPTAIYDRARADADEASSAGPRQRKPRCGPAPDA